MLCEVLIFNKVEIVPRSGNYCVQYSFIPGSLTSHFHFLVGRRCNVNIYVEKVVFIFSWFSGSSFSFLLTLGIFPLYMQAAGALSIKIGKPCLCFYFHYKLIKIMVYSAVSCMKYYQLDHYEVTNFEMVIFATYYCSLFSLMKLKYKKEFLYISLKEVNQF